MLAPRGACLGLAGLQPGAAAKAAWGSAPPSRSLSSANDPGEPAGPGQTGDSGPDLESRGGGRAGRHPTHPPTAKRAHSGLQGRSRSRQAPVGEQDAPGPGNRSLRGRRTCPKLPGRPATQETEKALKTLPSPPGCSPTQLSGPGERKW